jgi:hypothetical protein
MRLIAKAALGALALASMATAIATPASAQRMTVEVGPPNGVVIERQNPCLRPPELRPGFCFRHERRYWDRYAFNGDWRDRMWRDRERERERERQAFLDRRYYDMNR